MVTAKSSEKVSSYLEYLPAMFQSDATLGRFLLAFEQILSGLPPEALADDTNNPYASQLGLEQYLDRIHTYFNPGNPTAKEKPNPEEIAPAEFLPWLASWVALSLRDDWDEDTKRRFISQIVPLYRWRGTKKGLKTLLQLYTQEDVEIYEFDEPIHYFQVEMSLSNRQDLQRKEAIARAIIDQEKPAHTFYSLQLLFPTMQINNTPESGEEGILLGGNTILGTVSN